MTLTLSDPLAGITTLAKELYESGERENDSSKCALALRFYVEIRKARTALGLEDAPIDLARTEGGA